MSSEFKEIAHSGGKIIFSPDEHGYVITFEHSRPVPSVVIAIYATPDGMPISSMSMGGIGHVPEPPPIPGCLAVYIASDSTGKFGHNCPNCANYWRSGPWPNICPYCAAKFPSHEYLSNAQRRYVEHYCKILDEMLLADEKKEVVIDMDAVADASGKEGNRPAFYVSEESQQRKFTCDACEEFNDIIGRFGYCSRCGTRNDLQEFEQEVDKAIRDRLKAGNPPENCLKDGVSFFDSFMSQIAKQLAALAPLSERRRTRLLHNKFFDIEEVSNTFLSWFDIDIHAGVGVEDRIFLKIAFARRHIYEHNGGEVDQKYIDNSGDTSVRLKQHIHEKPEDVHQLLGLLVKMARNTHEGFLALFPPLEGPIKAFEDKKKRMSRP